MSSTGLPPLASPPLSVLLALLLSGAPLTAAAQAGTPRDTAQRIDAVEIVERRSDLTVGGAAALQLRVDSARLRVSPSLADLLRSVPQVHTRTNSRGEVELSVRGGESRQAMLMLNGLPLSPGWDGRADASLIPLSAVSSVSVLRSSGSILGGPNAIGGIVDLRVEAAPSRMERSLQLGSDQTGARLASASAGGRQDLGRQGLAHWRVGGGYRGVDGVVRAPSVPDAVPDARLRTNTDQDSRDLFVSGGWHAVNGAALHALYSAYVTQRGVAPELHLANPRRWRYPAQSRGMLQLRATAAPWEWAAGTTRAEVSLGLLNGLTRTETFADDRFTQRLGRESGDERVQSLRATLTHDFPRGVELRSAVTVNELRFDETLGTAVPDRYAQRLLSAGVEAQSVLGSRTLLVAGVVIDQGVTLASAGKGAAPAEAVPGWRLGSTVQVSERTRLHASASGRARFPALRELYSGALNRFEPNPELRPERLTTLESGLQWGGEGNRPGLRAQLTGFHHRMDDAVVRVGFPGTDRFIRVNRDRTDASGGEFTVGWVGRDGASATADVVTQRVLVSDPRVGGSGRKPEHQPGLRAGLDARWPMPGRVFVGTRLQHIGAQYCVNPEIDRDIALAAQSVVGATLERSWRGLRVLLGVDNVGNVAAYEQCGIPRPGRTVHVGLTIG